MSNKTLIGIIAVLVVIGGVLVLGGNLGKNSNTGKTTNNPNTSSGQAVVTGKPITEKIETVNITNSGFNPSTITIGKNVKVIWINRSGSDVNIVPSNGYVPLTLGQFPDNSSVQLSFDKSGTYTYQNQLKPSQKGTVIVR